jgi:KipI family sensor histidine kinase inhibitor
VAGVAISAFGDAAILIELGAVDPAGPGTQALAALLRDASAAERGFGPVVPAADTILVHIDPAVLEITAAIERLEPVVAAFDAADAAWPDLGPPIEIPVRYGGEAGPDLDAVAQSLGCSPASVIERHAAAAYRVLFLGFCPGFGYLGPLAPDLLVSRRASPRVRVPAGSVAIAGPHTAVYPVESPGGWQILGRTGLELWNPARPRPALLVPGALVRFVPEAGA